MVTAREVAGDVLDPELPMVTLTDLGILRDVRTTRTGTIIVEITPTYTGCPALTAIATDVVNALQRNGFRDVEVRTVWQPPWSTDQITTTGRRKLAAAGIAPPGPAPRAACGPVPLTLHQPARTVPCPLCGGTDTVETSQFGPTACTAIWRCERCGESFEHVKAI